MHPPHRGMSGSSLYEARPARLDHEGFARGDRGAGRAHPLDRPKIGLPATCWRNLSFCHPFPTPQGRDGR